MESKYLDAIECLRASAHGYCDETATNIDDLRRGFYIEDEEALALLSKQAEALAIIKEKQVNCYMLVWYFECSDYKDYVRDFEEPRHDTPMLSYTLLTEDEYNLLIC